jgi:hydrogenase expression/formation protein HypE
MASFTCPISPIDNETIVMAHGGGGRAMHRLLDTVFLPAFANRLLMTSHDGAVIDMDGLRLAFTTDSYVVHPLFFPGGDIGTLAVNGTVNDLAMCGARPLFLSAGFILEEGLPIDILRKVTCSMQAAAAMAEVQIVTGDTKVIDKGNRGGLFINTAGIGVIEHTCQIAPEYVQAGDAILINGDIGRHGIAIMSVREGLEFESLIESDCAPLAAPVMSLLKANIEVHCLRDLTRGGLASGLCEIAKTANVRIEIEEAAVEVTEAVRGACEILGLDPFYVANEGRFIAFVPPKDVESALSILGERARQIGTVTERGEGLVIRRSVIGSKRLLDMLNGEQLPRIC